jgi:hypothetical protein
MIDALLHEWEIDQLGSWISFAASTLILSGLLGGIWIRGD